MKGADARLGLSSSLLVSWGGLFLLALGAILAFRFHSLLLAGLCLFFLLMGLMARRWSARAMEQVTLEVECAASRLFPGQTTVLRYKAENRKFLPLVWLELSQNGPEKDCILPDSGFESYAPPGATPDTPNALRQSFSSIGSYGSLQADTLWTAQRRGVYHIQALAARSGDGFGLAQKERPLPADRCPLIAVYPRQVEVDLSLFLSPQWDCVSGRHGWSEDHTVLRGSREYQNGDNWKHINWRMAAREQGLPVNLFETVQPRGFHFILDGESFCGREDRLEGTLEILASLLIRLAGAGIPCSLTLPRSRRYAPLTLKCDEEGDLDVLLLHLAGYDCLEAKQEGRLLPSQFPGNAVPQTGSVFLLTHSGSRLPQPLLPKLEERKAWVLSAEDWQAPQRLGLRAMALDALRKGGGIP